MIFLGTNWKVYYMDNGLVCILRWIKSSVQVNAWRVDTIWYISFMLFEIGSKPVEGPSEQWNELVNWGKAKTMSLCKQVIYICLCSLQIILFKTFYIPFWMILILTKGFRKDIGEACHNPKVQKHSPLTTSISPNKFWTCPLIVFYDVFKLQII